MIYEDFGEYQENLYTSFFYITNNHCYDDSVRRPDSV